MPPKRGRGRGRGGPPGRQEQDFPQRQERRDIDPRRPPPGRQEQDVPREQQRYEEAPRRPPGFEQRPPRGRGEQRRVEQKQKPPPGFFAASPPQEEPVPEPPHVKHEKRKERTVDPAELGIELKHKLAISTPLPVRPDQGTLGRRIRLFSNCFPIKVPSGNVYHYDVEIIPKSRNPESEGRSTDVLPAGASKKDKKYRCLSTKKNREIINLMLRTNRNFEHLYAAYDGQKNLYTRKALDIKSRETLTCEVIMPNDNPGNPNDPRGPRQDVFQVQIKPVKKKDTESCAISLDSLHALFEKKTSSVPQETIMALETILRQGPCLKFTPIGRSFFYPPNPEDIHPLGGGREIWFGYHQSLRLGQWKPMVNLDITATTFYQKAPVIKYIADFLRITVEDLRRKPYLNDAEIKHINSELKSMRIEVTHLPSYRRKYRIVRVVKENANRLEFSLSVNGTTVRTTVADYFRDHHKRELRFPNLPCLQVNPEAKKVYLPVEVCEVIEGQHCKKKLDEKQGADMIKFTARPPDKRFGEIRDILRRADFNRDRYMREFGLEVSRDPLSLEGRVLDAPSVRYKDDAQIRPRDGSWNMQETQFFRGANIDSWVMISFSNPRYCGEEQLNKFARMLEKIGRETGISLSRPNLIRIMDNRYVMKNLLLDMKNKYKADLVVVVVPSRNKSIYGDIKQAAETVVGLTTQCVKDDNVVKKCNPQLVSNLCQKINAKMGGVNNALVPGETPAILRKPVIIIGADVTHPGPSHEMKPSLAACVGSLDGYPSRYAVTCRAQTNIDDKKQAIEIILDLKNMVHELLKAFYRHTKGKKPEKIIFYRDGVSEGQFEKVRDHEIKCIREACRSLGEDYQPGITFIVVQKRHHTRFIPQDSRDGVGRMKNIPPGTTVDTTVTHPLNFDFFLCSHFGIQGTSRPSHYTVIEDDNDFTANDLQKLTYYLCHTYVRCTKSISTPAPVAYAHLAAYRARQHLVSQIEESTTSSDTSSSGVQTLPQAVMEAIKVLDGLKSTMYFV